MAGFFSFFEIFVSQTVEFSGGGLSQGGKGILLAGARKIGWAGPGGNGRQGQRLSGHSIGSNRMVASGLAGGNRGRLGTYDPKSEYSNMAVNSYNQAVQSGSGAGKSNPNSNNNPEHLFGRPGFKKPSSDLGREGGDRYLKKSAPSANYTKRPRSNINY